MARYNLYDDGQYHAGVKLIAVRTDSDLDMGGAKFVATVDTDSTNEFDPNSSAFQSNQTEDYIETGLAWPNNKAVVVR